MGRVPSRGSDQFIIRFPDGMRDALKADAAKNGRSMNAEIVAKLEHYDQVLDGLERAQVTISSHDFALAAIMKERDALQTELLELRMERADLRAEIHRLRERHSALSSTPPVTPEAFDALFAEVRATRELVEASKGEDFNKALTQRWRDLKDDRKAKIAFMQEVQDVMQLMKPHEPASDDEPVPLSGDETRARNLANRRRLRENLLADRDRAARMTDADIEATLDQNYPVSKDEEANEAEHSGSKKHGLVGGRALDLGD